MILLRNSKFKVVQPLDVAKVFQDLLKLEDKIDREKEHFYVMHLDARQQINLVELVAIGTITGATIHARETFRRAIAEGTVSIIIAHNHPSGDVNPSADDITATHTLLQAGEILGIPVLDHIVFTATNFYSFGSNK
jgi:DNA repair protein RadC